jgi:hypothetical protein
MFEIGNSLREARLRQGLDFPDVERGTKIRPKYLRALEDEQFEVLPAQTYVKGFLRSYAEYLGLDGQLYVDEYNSRYVTREDDVPFRPRRSTAGRRRNGRLQSAIVVAALVGIASVFALVIAAWNSGDETRRPEAVAPSGVVRAPAPLELVVRAVRGSTRMAIHDGGRYGKQRFAGTLENGRTQGPFTVNGRLWLWIQRPGAVDLVVGGRTVAAPDRFVLVSNAGVKRAPAN